MRHLDALFLINVLKTKLVAHLFWLPLVSMSITDYLIVTMTCNFKVNLQPDVFLLPLQSVEALTSFTEIAFCSLILVSFLDQNNFLFLCLVYLVIAFYLFYCFLFYCLL
jgi:hypothetical protein